MCSRLGCCTFWRERTLTEALRARPKLRKTLYLASSNEDTEVTQRFADALAKHAASGVRWFYEKMPGEKHSTIYHPAALKAFRAVFKPAASN
jgi:hypothetical protein